MRRRNGRNGSSSSDFSGDTTAYRPTSLHSQISAGRTTAQVETHLPPQNLPGCHSLACLHREMDNALQWLMGFLWALPTPLQVQMQKGWAERTLKSLTSATSQNRKEWKKWAGVSKGFWVPANFGELSKPPEAVMQVFHMTAKQQEHRLAKLSLGMEIICSTAHGNTPELPYCSFADYNLCWGNLFTATLCYK